MPLDPVLDWRPGDVSGTLPQFEPAPPIDVSPPNAGSGEVIDRSGEWWRWPALLAALGAAMLWGALFARRNAAR